MPKGLKGATKFFGGLIKTGARNVLSRAKKKSTSSKAVKKYLKKAAKKAGIKSFKF